MRDIGFVPPQLDILEDLDEYLESHHIDAAGDELAGNEGGILTGPEPTFPLDEQLRPRLPEAVAWTSPRDRLPCAGLITSGSGGGGLVRVLPRVTYTLNPAPDQIEEILLAKYVDTVFWTSATLVVRVHAAAFQTELQAFSVVVRRTSFAEEAPSEDLAEPTPVAQCNIDPSTNTPSLLVAAFGLPIPSEVQVVLLVRQDREFAEGMSCTLGVDLIGRPH